MKEYNLDKELKKLKDRIELCLLLISISNDRNKELEIDIRLIEKKLKIKKEER